MSGSARPAATDHGAHGTGNSPAGRHPEPSGAAVSLPRGVTANPRVSQWLAVHGDGTVHVFSGKTELGQGILTALGQIAADELGVAPHRVLVLAATTASGPDQGFTAGSMSIADADCTTADTTADTDGEAPMATTSMSATYTRGFLAHASIPSRRAAAPRCGTRTGSPSGRTARASTHCAAPSPRRRASTSPP